MFWILFKEGFSYAAQSLLSNKLRSFLSLLGITIGIFAIILVFTIVDSLEGNIKSSLQKLGTNTVFVQKWPWSFDEDYAWWKYINRPIPKYEELKIIKDKCKTVEYAAFRFGQRKTLKYKSISVENAIFAGVSYEYNKIQNFVISKGRYFSQDECEAGYNICVIGDKLVSNLFTYEDPIGKEIKIAGRKVTIVGVIKKEGESMMGASNDYQVLTPFNFARRVLDMKNENADPTIYVKSKPNITNAQMIDELTGVMRAARKLKPKSEENFALNEISLLTKGFNEFFDVLGIAGWVIGGFSILVGGFGIANIMFVSVRERTNQIGIQKSLGAINLFILIQFLVESVLLSIIGGIFGLFLTWLITLIGKDIIGMEITLSMANIVLAFTISVLIGVISGFIPAYSASQLDPVEAIRSN